LKPLVRKGGGASLATLLSAIVLALAGCSGEGKQASPSADRDKGGGTASTSITKPPSPSGEPTKPSASRGQRPGRPGAQGTDNGSARGGSAIRRVRRACARLRPRLRGPLSRRLSQDVSLRARAALPSEQVLAGLLRSAARRQGGQSLKPLAQAHQTLVRAYVQASTPRGGASQTRALGEILRGLERQTRQIGRSCCSRGLR